MHIFFFLSFFFFFFFVYALQWQLWRRNRQKIGAVENYLIYLQGVVALR